LYNIAAQEKLMYLEWNVLIWAISPRLESGTTAPDLAVDGFSTKCTLPTPSPSNRGFSCAADGLTSMRMMVKLSESFQHLLMVSHHNHVRYSYLSFFATFHFSFFSK
jgi:hypothetical protein